MDKDWTGPHKPIHNLKIHRADIKGVKAKLDKYIHFNMLSCNKNIDEWIQYFHNPCKNS